MATRDTLQDWLEEALKANNGKASLLQVCKHVWGRHENELRNSGDLFYTWQYDIRWAATKLRQRGIMRASDDSPRGIWELDKK